MRNWEITQPQPLLNQHGLLTERGFSKRMLLQYDRAAIKANKLRIKEWDYYLIGNDEFAVALTIADNSYMGLVSASVLDFKQPSEVTKSVMSLLPLGKTKLPSASSAGDVVFQNKKVNMAFLNDGQKRSIRCNWIEFDDGRDLTIEIDLTDEPTDSIVIATPFANDDKAFYYNQKINCLRANGRATLGSEEYVFHPESSFGVLDWGRGVWTYKNTWYWGSGSGMIAGKTFGFNIGYGFGDTAAASENMLFYDGIAHKLDDIIFHIPIDSSGKEDYLKQWKFSSSDQRFEMEFTPIIDRYAHTSVGIISSEQHQVFGTFDGKAILDDGTILTVSRFLGFAEKVKNRW